MMEEKFQSNQKGKVKIKAPKRYKVVMHNDDFTTAEFVVTILIEIFHKTVGDANTIMMDVHKKGKGIVGIYSYDIARTKVGLAMQAAKEENFPFRMTIEE